MGIVPGQIEGKRTFGRRRMDEGDEWNDEWKKEEWRRRWIWRRRIKGNKMEWVWPPKGGGDRKEKGRRPPRGWHWNWGGEREEIVLNECLPMEWSFALKWAKLLARLASWGYANFLWRGGMLHILIYGRYFFGGSRGQRIELNRNVSKKVAKLWSKIGMDLRRPWSSMGKGNGDWANPVIITHIDDDHWEWGARIGPTHFPGTKWHRVEWTLAPNSH